MEEQNTTNQDLQQDDGKVSNDNCYSVYKHTNIINGKVYIGITRRKPEDRWGKDGHNYASSGNPHFWNAIIKYGWDNFLHEILFTGLSKSEAEQKEINLISECDSANQDFGYNIQKGGNTGGKMADETKSKISQSNKGKKRTEEAKQKMRDAALRTSERRRALFTERRKNFTPWHAGRVLTEEEKDKFKGKTYKPVRCVETGVVYKSMSFAAKELGLDQSRISLVCRFPEKTCGGVHFVYA